MDRKISWIWRVDDGSISSHCWVEWLVREEALENSFPYTLYRIMMQSRQHSART